MQTQDRPPADDQTDMSHAIAVLSSAISALRDRAEAAEQRADLAEQRIDVALSTLQKAGEALTAEQAARLAAETEAAQLRQAKDRTRADADEAVRAAERSAEERITVGLGLLREAAETLAAERIARAEAEEQAADRARREAWETAQAAEAEAEAAEQARAEAWEASKRAEDEAAQLRQELEQARADAAEAIQTAEVLRHAEAARATEAARDPAERANLVALKIDEVQFRRLQEAEQARKSLGRLARLRAAWRGE